MPRYLHCAILATFLPPLVQLAWILHNTQLPVADAVEPLLNSFYTYQHAAHHEWWKFLSSLYTMRDGGRPIGFYLVEVPFQLLSGGNLMFAAAATTLLCTSLTCLYIYRLLHIVIEPWPAALGTVLIGLTPVVQWPATSFALTEVAFMPAALAAIYYLIRSQNLQLVRESICFLLALFIALMMRPVESILHFLPLCALVILLAWRRRSITPQHLYAMTMVASAAVCILLLVGVWQRGFALPSNRLGVMVLVSSIAITAAVMLLGLLYFIFYQGWRYLRLQEPPYVLPVFAALCGLSVLYYFPYILPLVEWIYATSFGNLASTIEKPPLLQVLEGFALCTGSMPFVVITALGALSLLLSHSKERRKMLLTHPLMYLACLIPLPLLMALATVQFAQRKMTMAICAWLILMLIPALMPGGKRGMRIKLLTFAALWQLGGVLWIYTGHPYTEFFSSTIGVRELSFINPMLPRNAFAELVTTTPNPHETIADFVIKSAQRHGYKRVGLELPGNGPRMIDPFLLAGLIRVRSDAVEAKYVPFTHEFDNYSLLQMLQIVGDDAFLLVPDRPTTPSPEETQRFKILVRDSWVSSDKLAFALLALDAQGKLEELGFKKSDCTKVAPTKLEVCMFEVPKP